MTAWLNAAPKMIVHLKPSLMCRSGQWNQIIFHITEYTGQLIKMWNTAVQFLEMWDISDKWQDCTVMTDDFGFSLVGLFFHSLLRVRLGSKPLHRCTSGDYVLLIAGFFTCWMLFLLRKQRRQSTEGVSVKSDAITKQKETIFNLNEKKYSTRIGILHLLPLQLMQTVLEVS